MESNEKPFACSTDGCNMRFTNEDHLTVHQKKHDMILNLGNGQKMNAFVADQTPTPTRFIRNCEEVGLFQDLQINPFDETFRKAVEAGKTGSQSQYGDSLHLPASSDDTLHTPHVFPFPNNTTDDGHHYKSQSASLATLDQSKKKPSTYNHQRSSSSDSNSRASTAADAAAPSMNTIIRVEVPHGLPRSGGAKSTSQKIIQPTTVKQQKRPIEPTDPVLEKKQETIRVAGQAMQLLLRMPDGKLVQLVQEKNTSPSPADTPIPTPENGLALAKMKLKQALVNNGRIVPAGAEVTVRPPTVRVEPASPSTSPHSMRRESSNGSGDEEDNRKHKFRERNRAAAMRCREKRKTWVQELERRAEKMQAVNQQLQNEVTSLRAEVAQLKTLLLAHKNCPITQAMNQCQMINVSTLPMETIQTCLLPTSQPSRIMYQPTATTSRQTSPETPSGAPKSTSPSPSKRPRVKLTPHKHSEAKEPDGNSITLNGRVVRSVVVTNPNTSSCQSRVVNQPTIVSSPYINFKHLLSACATNENNLNMEKSGAMLNSVDSSDDDRSEASGSATNYEGTESKVIKLNPNATRFRNAEEIISRDVRMVGEDQFVIEDEEEEGDEETITDS